MDRFKGRCIHPQLWPEDLDYAGKKVVVIGSGATAVTMVPAMADDAEHVTMLQRSPSYIFTLPALDKISEFLGRFLPAKWVYGLARKRNIAVQRGIYQACRRWPTQMRRLLLWLVRRQVGPSVDMSHFTPNYMPWDERLCAVPNGDLFKVLKSGEASVVTDQIDTFTENGILLKSGRELEADIIVTATGLNLQMLGGMKLFVDGAARELGEQMTYKAVLVEDIPNLAWIVGYTNASWTLKSDIAATYLCRLLKHMEDNGHTVATPRDVDDSRIDIGMFDQLQFRLRAAREGHTAAARLQAAVEGAHALREGLEDAARRSCRRRPAPVRARRPSSALGRLNEVTMRLKQASHPAVSCAARDHCSGPAAWGCSDGA